MGSEQIREDPRHHPAVLHDVGDTRRRAQVVLQNPEGALAVTNQVDTRDMDADAIRRVDADGFPVEVFTGGDQPARDDAIAQDLLVPVNIVEEPFQGDHPLGDTSLQPRPFGRRDDPGHQIQWEGPLLTGQREGDALIDECPAERLGAGTQLLGAGRRQFGENPPVGPSRVALAVKHLVESRGVGAKIAVAAEDVIVDRQGRRRGGLAGPGPGARRSHASHAALHPPFPQAERLHFGHIRPLLVFSHCAARAPVPAMCR